MPDEYWKKSLMTFLMMLIFETAVIFGRLCSLRELRGVRNPSRTIHAFRNKKWAPISSLELLPGDIISIGRGNMSVMLYHAICSFYQRKLMRTILYSTESVSANSGEAALFILFLLVFALAASGYVFYHRYNENARGRYKQLLRCVLIITSVVPTELPMQLALVVNTSQVALVRAMIFCTEPHRIPYARKVDICCFDKTGTITTDAIKAAGVALAPDQVQEANKTENTDLEEYPVIPVHEATTA